VIPRAAIIAGAASAAVAFGFAIGWGANGWRLGAGLELAKSEASRYRAEVLAEKAAAAERVRKVEGDWNAKYQTAVNAARDRESSLRADLVAVRDASQRLRDQQADAATRIATTPTSTLADYTITLSAVFEDCRAAYAGMGEVAQRHADDARTLIEAWPVNQE
jgi:hypothetical protein